MKIDLLVILCGFSLGCTSKDSPNEELGEGEHEYDPGPSPGPAGDPDPDPDDDPEPGGSDTGDTDDTGSPPDPVEPSGLTVCYPGEVSDYAACFPLVEASADMGSDYDYPEPRHDNPLYSAPVRYIDLRVSDHSQALAPNFVFEEFMHQSKGPFGLFQVHAVESLQAIREASGGAIYVNSGYRNIAYNEEVGGVEHSRHIYGDAVDMTSAVLSLTALAELCEDFGAGYTQVYEDSHVHCDWRNDPLDPAFFE